MVKKKITDLVRSELEPFLEKNGYELFNVEFLKEGRDWFLKVYIDKCADGVYVNVGTDDCEAVSRFLSERMDALDPIQQNYYLEVSSPGLERPLLSEKDYRRFQGETVELSLYEPLEGKKQFAAVLLGLENGLISLEENGKRFEVPLDKVAKAKLAVIF